MMRAGSSSGKKRGEEKQAAVCADSRVSFFVPLSLSSVCVCVAEQSERGATRRGGFREKIYECSALRDLPVKVRPALRL